MKAKRVNENISFERDQDPKKSLKIGSGRYKYPPQDIMFSSDSSDSGTPKISCTIKGLKPRWYGMWYGSGDYSDLLKKEIVEFLNSPETKEIFAQKLNKVFDFNESQNFKRGQDPKKTMGIGINDYEDYVRMKLREKYPDEDIQDLEIRFWESFYDGFQDEKGYDVAESMMEVLKHTPLEYQMEWIQGDLEMFFEMKDEEDEG